MEMNFRALCWSFSFYNIIWHYYVSLIIMFQVLGLLHLYDYLQWVGNRRPDIIMHHLQITKSSGVVYRPSECEAKTLYHHIITSFIHSECPPFLSNSDSFMLPPPVSQSRIRLDAQWWHKDTGANRLLVQLLGMN